MANFKGLLIEVTVDQAGGHLPDDLADLKTHLNRAHPMSSVDLGDADLNVLTLHAAAMAKFAQYRVAHNTYELERPSPLYQYHSVSPVPPYEWREDRPTPALLYEVTRGEETHYFSIEFEEA